MMKLTKQNSIALISLLFVMMLGIGVVAQNIKGNGDVIKQERTIGSFDAIEVGGAFEIVLKQGNKEECIVEADANLIEHIITEVKGNTLKIYQDKSFKNAESLNLYITFVKLNEIEISGAAELKGDGLFKLEELSIDASGASELEMEVKAKSLELDLSGACEVELMGEVREMTGDFSGASEFEGEQLKIMKADIESSGSADVELFVSEELKIDASGASSVDIKGSPNITKRVSGAADIDHR